MEEETELNIELATIITNIAKKEKDILKIKQELDIVDEEEEKGRDRFDDKEDEEIEIGTYGRDDCLTNYDDGEDIENLVEKLSYIQVHESLL